MSNVMKDALDKAGATSKKNKNKNKNTSAKAPTNLSKMMKGKIKWFNLINGFGFVIAEDGNEYFVHTKSISVGRTYIGYESGDEVEFRVQVNPNTNKTSAVNVMLSTKDGNTAADSAVPPSDTSVDAAEDTDAE